MKIFTETFNTRPLSEWDHQPPISAMCPALDSKVEIVGWKNGLEQGTTHFMLSMEEFLDAHVNGESTRNNLPVAPFFSPKPSDSGPDLLFVIRIDGSRLVPVFVQLKLWSSSFSEREWDGAFSTVSAPKIEEHAKFFRKYCPEKVYISMVVAYPTKWAKILLQPEEQSKKILKDSSSVQQVVINVGDHNFGNIFPKDHVEFINRLKNAGEKRTATESGSEDESCSKKHRRDPRKIKKVGKRTAKGDGSSDRTSSEEHSGSL
ncbi:hypothetical protein BGZ58_003018 [Dissophora ornata]|nr:hypothetical protein BGZ58_003018 [Dissophora ornata]